MSSLMSSRFSHCEVSWSKGAPLYPHSAYWADSISEAVSDLMKAQGVQRFTLGLVLLLHHYGHPWKKRGAWEPSPEWYAGDVRTFPCTSHHWQVSLKLRHKKHLPQVSPHQQALGQDCGLHLDPNPLYVSSLWLKLWWEQINPYTTSSIKDWADCWLWTGGSEPLWRKIPSHLSVVK